MSFRSTKTPFKYMKQFKAIAMDWEYFSSLSDEGELYCLSEQQVYIILAQADYVGWLTRWYNTEDITQTTVDRVKSDLMEALMSCVDVSILVDQAALNLVDSVTTKQLASQALRDALEAEYDGDPTSINPDAPTTDFGSSGDRLDALCAGLMAFVYQFARNQTDSVRAGQVGGLIAVSLVAALLIPGLNVFFLVGASIAVLLGLGTIGVTTEVAIQALTDTEALDNVVCYMRDVLKSQGVSEANWSSCLNTYPFGTGSHEAIVADFLKACLADNYLTILNILGASYAGVTTGEIVPECPCDPEAYIYQWDFNVSDGGWEVLGAGQGTYSGGAWVMQAFTAVTAYVGVQIGKGIPSTANVTSMEVDLEDVVLGANVGGRVVDASAGVVSDPSLTLAGDNTYFIDIVQTSGTLILVARASNGDYTGSGLLKKVRVYGTASSLPAFTGGAFI